VTDDYMDVAVTEDKRIVNAGVVTVRDKLVGTGGELNGRSYNVIFNTTDGISSMEDVEVGFGYIRRKLSLTLERIVVNPEVEPDIAYAVGSFTALAN